MCQTVDDGIYHASIIYYPTRLPGANNPCITTSEPETDVEVKGNHVGTQVCMVCIVV